MNATTTRPNGTTSVTTYELTCYDRGYYVFDGIDCDHIPNVGDTACIDDIEFKITSIVEIDGSVIHCEVEYV